MEETAQEELENEPTTPIAGEEVAENTAPETVTPEEAQEKYSRKVQKSINRYTRKATQAEQEAERLRAENAELKKAVEIKSEPDADDYSDNEKYTRDKAQWTGQQEAKIRADQTQKINQENWQRAQQDKEDQQLDDYLSKKPKAIKEFENYAQSERAVDQAVNDAQQMGIDAREIRSSIYRSNKYGTAMVNYLGNNPDELAQLVRLSPAEQAYAMGKIEARVEAKPLKTKSTAPGVAEPTKGSAQTVTADASLNQYDWNRKKNGFA